MSTKSVVETITSGGDEKVSPKRISARPIAIDAAKVFSLTTSNGVFLNFLKPANNTVTHGELYTMPIRALAVKPAATTPISRLKLNREHV